MTILSIVGFFLEIQRTKRPRFSLIIDESPGMLPYCRDVLEPTDGFLRRPPVEESVFEEFSASLVNMKEFVMTRRVVCVLFVSLFVFAIAQVASAQDAAVAAPEVQVVTTACADCVVPCGPRCCVAYRPVVCDPCCAPVPIGYRRGFLGICRPVYAAPCDPCCAPMPPRFYRPWYRGCYW